MKLLLASLGLLVATTALADRGHGRSRHRPRPIDLGHLQTITNACESAFDGDANEQACVQTVMSARGRFDAPSAITACESAFDGDANELACLGIAVHSWQAPAPLVTSCESAFDGDANELTCLRTMTQSWLTATAVTACESAFDGDANEQACLGALVGTRYDAAQLVSYCEQNNDGDANELACLGQFR
jgi:hypothetical protein